METKNEEGMRVMRLGTTYICVDNMERSLNFYREILQQEPILCNEDRWVSFECGISLYNRKYDEKLIKEGKNIYFNQAYLNDFKKNNTPKINNIVIFNFEVEDLEKEYKRIQDLSIGEVSEILFVNVHMPYYYFNITDPDGNVLEITGNYEGGRKYACQL